MRLRAMLIFCGLAAIAAAAPATLAQSAVDRPAEVRGGTCDSLGEVVATLANLVITIGDPQGQLLATPVEQSGTVVPFAVSDFLGSDHSVVVQESPGISTVVACGEVGGALNPDGTLAVGMRAMNDSGLSGVAYFTPIDTFANTLVTILLVNDEAPNTATAVDGASNLDDTNTNPQ
ncbi:MAG: hypothetical protein K0S78_1629 [Thermomicrobiales bacterium]|nr:hypothetical protein [Thermomicrobiales bacterium]MDF3038290.1 hypothetical protein [Thermomicrobiales bacterium]